MEHDRHPENQPKADVGFADFAPNGSHAHGPIPSDHKPIRTVPNAATTERLQPILECVNASESMLPFAGKRSLFQCFSVSSVAAFFL